MVTTDLHPAYRRAIRWIIGRKAWHRTTQYLNNYTEQSHRGVYDSVSLLASVALTGAPTGVPLGRVLSDGALRRGVGELRWVVHRRRLPHRTVRHDREAVSEDGWMVAARVRARLDCVGAIERGAALSQRRSDGRSGEGRPLVEMTGSNDLRARDRGRRYRQELWMSCRGQIRRRPSRRSLRGSPVAPGACRR